jgi:hypothetical protein
MEGGDGGVPYDRPGRGLSSLVCGCHGLLAGP